MKTCRRLLTHSLGKDNKPSEVTRNLDALVSYLDPPITCPSFVFAHLDNHNILCYTVLMLTL